MSLGEGPHFPCLSFEISKNTRWSEHLLEIICGQCIYWETSDLIRDWGVRESDVVTESLAYVGRGPSFLTGREHTGHVEDWNLHPFRLRNDLRSDRLFLLAELGESHFNLTGSGVQLYRTSPRFAKVRKYFGWTFVHVRVKLSQNKVNTSLFASVAHTTAR